MSTEIAAPMLDVGERILRAIEATRAVVSANTNLGIVLLCAPLAHAATVRTSEPSLRVRVHAVLSALDVYDAELAYRAIRMAQPGGLGQAERHDVMQSPCITLAEAMREARERDRIAYQYVSDFQDVFETGVPALQDGMARWRSREWATVHAYLVLLALFEDSHIVRKHGFEVAAGVSLQARALNQTLQHARDLAQEMPALAAFDRQLKARSINPGTTADLTVAALVAMDLQDSLEKSFSGTPEPDRRQRMSQ
jgi:triphosphoribosyl-dephospho-CoA synthase